MSTAICKICLACSATQQQRHRIRAEQTSVVNVARWSTKTAAGQASRYGNRLSAVMRKLSRPRTAALTPAAEVGLSDTGIQLLFWPLFATVGQNIADLCAPSDIASEAACQRQQHLRPSSRARNLWQNSFAAIDSNAELWNRVNAEAGRLQQSICPVSPCLCCAWNIGKIDHH